MAHSTRTSRGIPREDAPARCVGRRLGISDIAPETCMAMNRNKWSGAVDAPAYHNSTVTNCACFPARPGGWFAAQAMMLHLSRLMPDKMLNCAATQLPVLVIHWEAGEDDGLRSRQCFIKKRASHPLESHVVSDRNINLGSHTHYGTVTELDLVTSPCKPSGFRSRFVKFPVIFTFHILGDILDQAFDQILGYRGRSGSYLDLPSAQWWPRLVHSDVCADYVFGVRQPLHNHRHQYYRHPPE